MSEPVAYLLGELDDAQVAEFEQAMTADPALREEVERLRPVVTRLERVPGEAWDSPEPPPLVMPPDATAQRRRRRFSPPPRLVLRPLVAVACAVMLLAAGIGVGAWLDRDPVPPVGRLALQPVGDLDPGASGNIAVSDDGVSVRVTGLRPTDGDQFYELWLLGADKRLIGLGSFQVGEDGAATLKLPLPVSPDSFQFFDLSLEPGDGDPGHSGVSVLRGPTAA
jgi:anti-sigma-K factor RskA